jgi:hypothetical protein
MSKKQAMSIIKKLRKGGELAKFHELPRAEYVKLRPNAHVMEGTYVVRKESGEVLA